MINANEIKDNKQHRFYRDALQLLNQNDIPYLIGGAFALKQYTGIYRNTKDLDLFCKAGDYLEILKFFKENGFETEITDARWLAKVFKDGYFIDLIFNTTNNLCAVDDSWFDNARTGELYETSIRFVAPEELIWCKIYIQDRGRFDGADVNHLILRAGRELDWERVFMRLKQHWHLLLAQCLNFQFVYPSDRDIIPQWLFDELIKRAKEQYELPPSVNKVCLGPILDHSSYEIDIINWDYKVVTLKTT